MLLLVWHYSTLCFLDTIPFIHGDRHQTTPQYFNNFIKGVGSDVTKIIPMVAQAKFYFGYILTPLYSIIAVKLAIFFENLVEDNNDILKKNIYLYATMVFAVSPILYKLNIMLSNFWYIIMFIVLLKLGDLKVKNFQ